MSYGVAWMFLVLSIVLEVTGTSIMKGSQNGWPVLGMAVMYVLLGLSYFTLSKAVARPPTGVADAVGEGLGLCLITLASVAVLGEQMGPVKLSAIGMLLLGTCLVHHGTESGEKIDGAVKGDENSIAPGFGPGYDKGGM